MKRLKTVKRVLAIMLTLTLIITLSGIYKSVTYAADTYSITITNNNNDDGTHTYGAYKIFDITFNSAGEPSVTGWGAGVHGDNLIEALKADQTIGSYFTSATTAAQVAAVLTNNIAVFANDTADDADYDTETKAFVKVVSANLVTPAAATSNSNGVISGLVAGYYFVKDEAAPGPANPTTGDNNGAYTRFILQLIKNTSISISSKTDAPKLVIKIKEDSYSTDDGFGVGYNDVADYETSEEVPYELIATLPTNVSAYDTYKVVFNDTLDTVLENPKDFVVTINGTPIATDKYTISSRDDTTGLFTITIDDIFDAVGATTSAQREALDGTDIVVKYTATLGDDAVAGQGYENTVTLSYSNNPNDSGSNNTNLGLTPPDEVIVFTYKENFTKVDGADVNTKLKDAEFVLRKGTGTSAKYATIANGKVTGWVADEANATVLKSAADGTFSVEGLDSKDQYFLHETKAPEGYALAENDVEVTIDSAIKTQQNWTGNVADAYNSTVSGGIFTVAKDITNTKLTALPTTGGIGTTVFYVVGIILVLGAGVLLITRKRSRN
ncbi:isopeptide-forming domain-containing fimbrial protein [Eubacterium sp.]|uniref:isopeptide-forming domain-containing fimbrial protein n=1 Tax=Eubacterium sp. TaxID=142586 RepID=UPI0025F1A995|nr:isopeptide-forming domain-containing fimbrial protein [Eubacterium sp.]MCR5629746.1 isopeptide-forming domain-containing fimbrial protein [Eubacterium sp.]